MPTALRSAIVAIHAAPVLAVPALAQIPDEFSNLQFFPEDIPKEELVENMRQFSFALGVRCTHCHVAKPDNPSSVGDFASDDKAEKRKARVMLEMVKAINSQHLTQLPERGEIHVDVSCATCHGGVTTPIRLEDRMELVRAQDGLDAALQSYRNLRDRYYGRAAYDFGPRSLMNLGERLTDAGHADDAVAVFELNREFFPESPEVVFNLAKAYVDADRSEDAMAAYRAVLELAPDGWWASTATKAIQEL
ncbi:MAG TPA: c-type cytochrome, partial [bacterium]|nr:c-type cytochrome [bacterium]